MIKRSYFTYFKVKGDEVIDSEDFRETATSFDPGVVIMCEKNTTTYKDGQEVTKDYQSVWMGIIFIDDSFSIYTDPHKYREDAL